MIFARVLLAAFLLFCQLPTDGQTRAAHARSHTRTIPARKRSTTARHAFQRRHPCPATGKTTGACPHYVIDHVQALACGGADSPANMQWQTLAEAKEKDRWERVGCK